MAFDGFVANGRDPVVPAACGMAVEESPVTVAVPLQSGGPAAAPLPAARLNVYPLLIGVALWPRSAEMYPSPAPAPGGVYSTGRLDAYPPLPQVVEYCTSATVTALREAIADVSLPVIRERGRPGTAMAAMMLIIATTMSSSISVNPWSL